MDLSDVIAEHAGRCMAEDSPRWCAVHDSYWDKDQHACNSFVDLEDLVEGVLSEVCVTHGRFVPCRKDGEHRHTSDPHWVEAVRAYQTSTDDSLAWEPGQ